MNSKFTRPIEPFFKNSSRNLSRIRYLLKCWSFHKASMLWPRYLDLLCGFQPLVAFLLCQETLDLHSVWFCCSWSFSHAVPCHKTCWGVYMQCTQNFIVYMGVSCSAYTLVLSWAPVNM